MFVALSWLLITRPAAVAGDDIEDDKAAPAADERQFVINEEQFDQMVFQGVQRGARAVNPVQLVQGASGSQRTVIAVNTPEKNFRQRMENVVAIEIQAIGGRVSLTDAQKKKLMLAARGDIARVVDRAAELRPKVTSKPMNQQEYVALMREMQSLRMSQQFGIIGENSLFRKTLRHSLTDEQRLRWQALERERQKAIIETAIEDWGRMAVDFKLADEVRQKFTDLILDHGRLPQNVASYGRYIVLLEANLLRDRVKPLLTEDEWHDFEWLVGQAKKEVPTLESYGLWTARRSKISDDEAGDESKD